MSGDASAWGLNVVSLSPGDFPPNLRFPAPLISILLCLALPHTQFLPPKLPPSPRSETNEKYFLLPPLLSVCQGLPVEILS